MWQSRTKNDLIIEVWEKLDCENVGSAEIEAIELVIADKFGPAAVDSPMVLARYLADEGADLRHAEIMKLHVERASDRPYEAAFRNIIKIDDLKNAASSIRNLENLRRKFVAEGDKEGLRILRETTIQAKRTATEKAEKEGADARSNAINLEVANWLTIWMQTPEIFETWVELRQRSPEFLEQFGNILES